jgi:hypothetical protein
MAAMLVLEAIFEADLQPLGVQLPLFACAMM